jgi:hypothetical protein
MAREVCEKRQGGEVNPRCHFWAFLQKTNQERLFYEKQTIGTPFIISIIPGPGKAQSFAGANFLAAYR